MTDHDVALAALADAVAALFDVFATSRFEPGFAARCSPLGERRVLASRLEREPLAELDTEMLAVYCFKSLSTMGNEADFKHFLPRMLELFATDERWQHHDTQLWPKLAQLNWQAWPAPERAALERYVARLRECVAAGALPHLADEELPA